MWFWYVFALLWECNVLIDTIHSLINQMNGVMSVSPPKESEIIMLFLYEWFLQYMHASYYNSYLRAVNAVRVHLYHCRQHNHNFCHKYLWGKNCRQTSNISRTSVGNKVVDHSHVVRASPVGAAPTTFSFPNQHLASVNWTKTTAKRDEEHSSFRFGQ